MEIELRTASRDDVALFDEVAVDVFDRPIAPVLLWEFLSDPRHHIVVAIEDSARIVGFASAIHYVHPDKPPELWINEVGVSPDHHRRGLGSRLIRELLGLGRQLGCAEAWVLTERSNQPAMRLYESAGGEEAGEETVMFSFRL